jgi:hypothetical protein
LTPSPGTWVDPIDGQRHDDINTGFYVDVNELTPEIMLFLKEYKDILKARFKQKEIYITTQKINVI